MLYINSPFKSNLRYLYIPQRFYFQLHNAQTEDLYTESTLSRHISYPVLYRPCLYSCLVWGGCALLRQSAPVSSLSWFRAQSTCSVHKLHPFQRKLSQNPPLWVHETSSKNLMGTKGPKLPAALLRPCQHLLGRESSLHALNEWAVDQFEL